MNKFEIIIEIQDLTEKQRTQNKYLIRYKMISKEANGFQMALNRILNDKLDFSKLIDKEELLIKYRRTGRYKIEYNSINDKRVKTQIRRVIENSYPIIF